jgi:tetratricopeptide (TPR) repeat protein
MPHAWIVAVSAPKKLDIDSIRRIVIPAIFIWWGKPEIVLFLDDATQFIGKPVNALVTRLAEQCSRFAVVVTYCTGPEEAKLFADAQFRQLLNYQLSTAVHLGPLDSVAADEIYSQVWREKVGPLLADKSTPGAIVLGLDAKIKQYTLLPDKQRRILTAIRLASVCGARPCAEDFLWMVAEAVWGLSRDRNQDDLEELQRQQYIQISLINVRREVVPESSYYLDLDYLHHYSNVADYKSDLRKLEDLLVREHLTRRLADLGMHYWNDLQDLSAAQRALEAAVQGDPQDRQAALALSRLFMWLRDPDRAKTTIETLRDSIADPDEKAETILAFADEILYNVGQPETATGWYGQALDLAKNPKIRGTIAQRAADCHMKTGGFSQAEDLYRQSVPPMDGPFISARVVLALLGQNKTEDARTRLRQLWDETAARDRYALAVTLLDNAEGCFKPGEAALDATREIVWEHVVRTSKHANELAAFADFISNAGFLDSAAQAYEYIVQHAERLAAEVTTLQACYINLGATYRDQGRISDARSCFERALESLASQPFSVWKEGAEAGLGDCDLFSGGDLASARMRYELAEKAGERAEDAWVRTWGMLGLGDILVRERRWTEAERMYRDIELLPTNCGGETRFLLGLGVSCSRLGKRDDAQMYLARGLRRCNRQSYAARQQQFLAELNQLLAAGPSPCTHPMV